MVNAKKRTIRWMGIEKSDIFFSVFSLVIIFALYFKLWRSYFVQDEWYYFGLFGKYLGDPFGFAKIFVEQFTNIEAYGIHFTPLWNSLFLIEYQLFYLHYQYYALVALLLHFIATFLTYLLIKKLLHSKLAAFFGASFFAVCYTHYEAVTWANTQLQSQLPTIFILIIFLLLYEWILSGKNRYLTFSLVLFFITLLIKENVLGILVLIPIFVYLFGNKKSVKGVFLGTSLVGLIYGIFRFLIPLMFVNTAQKTDILPQGFSLGTSLFRILFYAPKAFVQQIVSPDIIVYFSKLYTLTNYPLKYGVDSKSDGAIFSTFVNSAGADIVMLLFSIPLIILVGLLLRITRKDNKEISKVIVFSLLFISLSVAAWTFIVPFILSLMPDSTFIPPRHLYLTSVGTSIFIASICYFFYEKIAIIFNKNTRKGILLFTVFYTLLFVFFAKEIYLSRRHIEVDIIGIGEQRQIIMEYIKYSHPRIPSTSVFFIISNRQYFGFEKATVPFQTNFGLTLLNLYQSNHNYSSKFYGNNFLLSRGVMGEGFQKDGKNGFGYYITGEKLVKDYANGYFPISSIFGYVYDGNARIFHEETDEIRDRVRVESKFSEVTKNWILKNLKNSYTNILVPPDTLVSSLVKEGFESYIIDSPSLHSVYSIDIIKGDGKKSLEEIAREYIRNNKYNESLLIGQSSWVHSLARVPSISIKDKGSLYFFVRHPSKNIFYAIRFDNQEQGGITPDLGLWSIRSY